MEMSFIEQISNHQIFKKITSFSAFQKKQSKSSKTNKVVSRNGNELFVAFENIVRCSEISSSHSNYKILELNIDFVIQNIEINKSGTLLAIVGDSKIIVSDLPAPGFMSNNSDSSLQVKSFSVAPLIFEETNVLKVLWNEIARYDCNLVVLSDDSHIRSFDLSFSSVQPQLSYDLIENDNSIENPVSITFGSSNDSVSALTLYILTEDTEIYSLSPFAPFAISVTEDFVENLFNESALLVQNFKNYSSDSGLKRNSITQLQYASDLWKQFPTAQKDIRFISTSKTVEDVFILNPKQQNTDTKLQGPFSVTPELDELATGQDLDKIECGGNTILVCVLSDGSYISIFQDRTPIMQWECEKDPDYRKPAKGFGFVDVSFTYEDFEETDYFTSFSLLEHIKLPLKSENFKLIGSSLPFLFFIVHKSGVVKIDCSSWGQVLSSSITTGNTEEFVELLSKPLETDVAEMSSAQGRTDKSVDGIVLLTDPITDESYVITISDERIDVSLVNESFSDGRKLIKSSEEDEPLSEPYESLLTAPFTEITSLLSLFKNHSNYKLSTDISKLIQPDENVLGDLNTISQDAIKKVISLHKVGLSMNHRLSLQQKELRQQISKLLIIKGSIEELDEKTSPADAISKVASRQESIKLKAERIIEKLNRNKNELPLSDEERSWFKEINQLNKYINSSANRTGLISKIDSLKKQMDYIRNQLNTSGFNDINSEKYDFDKLKKFLSQENKLIDHTNGLLNESLTKVEDQFKQLNL